MPVASLPMQLNAHVYGVRFWSALGIYIGIIIASFYLAYELRFDFAVPPEFQQERLELLKFAVGVKFVSLVLLRQTGSLLRYFSIPDLVRVAAAMGISSFVLISPRVVGHAEYVFPRGVLLIDLLLSIVGLCAFRLALRMYQERLSARGDGGQPRREIAIVGAGDTGASLAKELLNRPARGFRPVVFLDDDPTKRGRRVHGVPVVGAPEALTREDYGSISTVVMALPSSAQKRRREIMLLLLARGYKVEVMPAVEEIASGRAKVTQIRSVEVEDLLGRDPVVLDVAAIRSLVGNKVVLVTGAGGSIGSELCRQLARLNPRRLLLVEQSEPALFEIEQELQRAGLSGVLLPCIADVLDVRRMELLFSTHQPQIVFHAAAHKHVDLMERQPGEAIKNNAKGTRVIAQIAQSHHAEAFVLVSTDKAINPTSVMGASKRLAELHLQALQNSTREAPDPATPPGKSTKFMAVRFGNVLGSSGSVVPIFKRQIEAGGPVTVTHPEVTRYFMTIPEAVGLVLQASALGQGGEIFCLDMGPPVKILDLARNMIELSGYRVGEDIEIEFTGLKTGEKLFEELQHYTEEHAETVHPRIIRLVSSGDPTEASRRSVEGLESTVDEMTSNDIKRRLKELIPEYQPCFE